MKVLRRLDIKSISLDIAAQKTARDIRGDDEALPGVAEERVVATVEEPGRPELALKQRARLALDFRGSTRGHVEDIDLLQPIFEAAGGKASETFSRHD